MAEYNAGEARLRIVPDASRFREKLEADIRRLNVDFPVDLELNTRKAAEQLERFRLEQSRNKIDLDVDVDTGRVRRELSLLRSEVDKATGSSAGLGISLRSALFVGGAAFSPAIVTILADVAQGLQQVAQAGLAIPGIIGGAASSIGTLAIGLNGMGDALKAANKAPSGSAKDVEKYNEALAKLSPNAVEVVKAIGDMRPMFDDIQKSVSTELFAGMSTQLRQLATKDFPVFRKGLTDIAKGWNADLKQLTQSLGDGQAQGILGRLFGNTAEAQTRFASAIDPLVKGIGTLVAASSDALPRLADGLGSVAERFRAFITAADQDGRLKKWIDDGITGVSQLGESVLNIGKAFTAITGASGGGFLQWLQEATGKLQTFLNSDAGQQRLKEMFEAGREELHKIVDIAKNLGPVIGAAFKAAQDSLNVLLPPLQFLTGLLSKCPALVYEVATAFIAWKSVQGITSLITNLGRITGLLRDEIPAAAATGASRASGGLSSLEGKLNRVIAAAMAAGDLISRLGDGFTPGGGLQNIIDSTVIGASVGGAPGALLGVTTGVVTDAWQLAQLGQKDIDEATRAAEKGSPGKNLTPAQTQGIYGVAPGGGGAKSLDPGKDLGNLYGIPSRASGGPSPTSGLRGPTGGWITELHDWEWVLPKHARDAIGDEALWAITAGRSFASGGYIDPNGNPVTPGMAPGPSTPAAPLQTGLSSIAQAALGAVPFGGPIGNLVNVLNAPAPDPSTQTVSQQMGITGQTQFGTPTGNFMAAASALPGLWGMAASLASPDPAGAMMNWGSQTAGWLSNFTSNTLSSFGSSLLDGALGTVGLQQSIFSPSNPWTGAALQAGNFALGGSGPISGLLSSKGGGGTSLADAITGGGGGGGSMGLSDMFGIGSGLASGSGQGQGNNLPLNWKTLDAIAAQMGLSMTSGYRSPNGPTIAGVAAAKSFHALGRAHDYSNGVRTPQELQFAMFMAQNYGGKLKELIYDDPKFAYTVKDGQVVGPFGAYYTLAQAGNHSDHVHVAFDTGGWLQPGTTVAHNMTGKPELILNDLGQQRLANQGINPASLLSPGAPGQPPSSPADTAAKALESVKLPTIAAAPASQDHNNPAISRGISAGAAAIGSLVSSAIGAAASAAGAGAPGAGAGGAVGGALASTAIQMGGQFLTGAINLGSSLLVGSVPGSYGGAGDRAYGNQVRSQPTQAPPPVSATTWNVNGVSDVNRLIQEVDLRDAQHRAGLAKWGG